MDLISQLIICWSFHLKGTSALLDWQSTARTSKEEPAHRGGCVWPGYLAQGRVFRPYPVGTVEPSDR